METKEKYVIESKISFVLLLKYWLSSLILGVFTLFIYHRINELVIFFYFFGGVIGVLSLVFLVIPFFKTTIKISKNDIIIRHIFRKDITIKRNDIQNYSIRRIPCKIIFKGGLEVAYDEMTIELPIQSPYNLINYQYTICSKDYANYQAIFATIANETINLQADNNTFEEITLIVSYYIFSIFLFVFLLQSEGYRLILTFVCIYNITQCLYALSQVRMKPKIVPQLSR